MEYKENSIDSKITLILERQDHERTDRQQFRGEILTRLDKIESQCARTNGRVTKIESNEERQAVLNAKVIPLIEGADVARGTWFTLKNLMIGISFVLGLVATLAQIIKQ
jgi:hypothetical protein